MSEPVAHPAPPAADALLAPIAILRGLARMRAAARAGGRRPGQPMLALARPAYARRSAAALPALPWGVRWALGVIWGADGAPGVAGRDGAASASPSAGPRAGLDGVRTTTPSPTPSPAAAPGNAARPQAPFDPAATPPLAASAPRAAPDHPPATGAAFPARPAAADPAPTPAAGAPGSATRAARAEAMASLPMAMWLMGGRAAQPARPAPGAPGAGQMRAGAGANSIWATRTLAAVAAARPESPRAAASIPAIPAHAPGDPRRPSRAAPDAAPGVGEPARRRLPERRAPAPDAFGAPRPPGPDPIVYRSVQGAAPPATDPSADPAGSALPLRVFGPPPAAIALLAEDTRDLRDFVERELSQINERVTRVARRPAAPPPAPAPSGDATARLLLGRVRAILEEERFRSGKLR